MLQDTWTSSFYGWRVVSAAFVLAVFGLGTGFYGPPIFLNAVQEARGWSLLLVSSAVTTHFLIGAVVTANLPTLYARWGTTNVTRLGALSIALGVIGWAAACHPWQLFMAAALSGAGWVTMGVAAINAIVSPWFVRSRPTALAVAYNGDGANLGGVIFTPLWATGIALFGFILTAATIGTATVAVVWILTNRVLSKTPEMLGTRPDGGAPGASATPIPQPPSRGPLWRDPKFQTLAMGTALGLFAQIGLLAHLYSLLVPTLGKQTAGLAMGATTALAVLGRTLIGWLMPPACDRRLLAAASYGLQVAGSFAFMAAQGTNVPVIIAAIVMFGLAFGNGTWLPPLIAQVEFAKEEVQRVVALVVAISQGAYAFAPATLGLIRDLSDQVSVHPGTAPAVFIAAALIQALAASVFLIGRKA
jgi:Major Facilitator Superfamily